jgi:hypothetical protein
LRATGVSVISQGRKNRPSQEQLLSWDTRKSSFKNTNDNGNSFVNNRYPDLDESIQSTVKMTDLKKREYYAGAPFGVETDDNAASNGSASNGKVKSLNDVINARNNGNNNSSATSNQPRSLASFVNY